VAYLTNALQVRSLVPGEEVCRRASSGLILEVNVGEPCPLASRTMKQTPASGRTQGSGSSGPSQARKNNAIGEVLGKLFKAGGNCDREYLARPRVP
jgi:hypothetical protein